MADIGNMELKVTADISQVLTAMDAAGGSTGKFTAKATSDLTKAGNSFTSLGKSANLAPLVTNLGIAGNATTELANSATLSANKITTAFSGLSLGNIDDQFEALRNTLNQSVENKITAAISSIKTEVPGAVASINKLDAGITDLGTDANKTASDLNKSAGGIKSISGALNSVGSSTNSISKAGKGLNDLSKSGNTAGQSLTNLGRIAQDLPFGFIGIQNNLVPLTESFGRLKAETGSAGGAFRALASSLGGCWRIWTCTKFSNRGYNAYYKWFWSMDTWNGFIQVRRRRPFSKFSAVIY